MMRAAEMKTLRAIRGVRETDQIKSKVIPKDLKNPDICNSIDEIERTIQEKPGWKTKLKETTLPRDGTKAGHLLSKRLNNRRNKTDLKILLQYAPNK